ncbi:MAG: CAP domain-containing protein [Deltaproteobacteria bacterium]|nr:CAP domain-containing protein [Deltaproteobacteria bacterium]
MRRDVVFTALLLVTACTGGDAPLTETVGKVQQAYGEPQGGFPSWYERMIHVLVNRARADPPTALAGCSNCADASCFPSPLDPMEWDYDHARAARFHATNLTSAGCGMLHDSPCQLVGNIGTIYPGSCSGVVSCACQGGTASCSGGTSTWDRLADFGIAGGLRAENIAGIGDPFSIFAVWLWESTSNPTCTWTSQNGHRHNILGSYTRIGVGGDGSYTVQDFSNLGTVTEQIPAGAHYPQTGNSPEMRANWFDVAAPQAAVVNIDGTCYSLSIERGSSTNGTYRYDASLSGGCHEYYFIFVDGNAQAVTYPTTGSFGISCGADWSTNRPALGGGCPGNLLCGNSVLDSGETCDPPSSCPSTCVDGNSCTIDSMSGSPSTCDVVCTNTPITTCTNGDSCCPGTCDANNDTDCSPSCGNSVVESGETCDPPSSCPSSCTDGNACTVDSMTGSAQNCNVACTFTPITACTNGDSCCPGTCDANNDTDCSPSCGNSVVESGETCDPPSSCPTSCTDGNACTVDTMTGSAQNCNVACSYTAVVSCANGDSCCPNGCDSNTDDDCSPSCGNSVVESGETCDPPGSCPTSCTDGNACTVDTMTGSASNCNVACSYTSIVSCTNGDGCCPSGCDANTDDDCSASCGNNVVEAGETCDPPGSCPASCADGNACTVDTMTGSAANCNVGCSYTAIVSCTNGDGCCPSGCDANTDDDCSATCGNDTIEPGETCDPPASCVADCDDDIGCTVDTMTGSAQNCNVACSHTEIVSCGDGDGCCPAGCDHTLDDDCSASCGNDCDLASDTDCTCGDGELDPGETCDPPDSCPTECDDGDACTADSLNGSPDTCNVSCSSEPIVACQNGDGCCPSDCSSDSDDDCGAANEPVEGNCGCRLVGRGSPDVPWLLLLALVPAARRRRPEP